jgi:hypothetical protein
VVEILPCSHLFYCTSSLLLYCTHLRNSIVWCILALELIFEYLVRPPDYPDLIESDQAYAPSTARNINIFHLFFESVALMLFIPELNCLFDPGSCGRSVPWSGLWASLHAVDGSDSSRAAAGRLCLGLTSLRLFGLVRHWKQMWINNTFADDRQNSNLVRRFLLLEYDGKGKDPSKVRSFCWLQSIRNNTQCIHAYQLGSHSKRTRATTIEELRTI